VLPRKNWVPSKVEERLYLLLKDIDDGVGSFAIFKAC
jgi:hypothetical protein